MTKKKKYDIIKKGSLMAPVLCWEHLCPAHFHRTTVPSPKPGQVHSLGSWRKELKSWAGLLGPQQGTATGRARVSGLRPSGSPQVHTHKRACRDQAGCELNSAHVPGIPSVGWGQPHHRTYFSMPVLFWELAPPTQPQNTYFPNFQVQSLYPI